MKNSNLYEFDSEKDSNSLISEKNEENEEEEEIKIDIKLLTSIANTLIKVLEESNKDNEIKQIIRNQKKMPFSSNTAPQISIFDYLKRIQTYGGMENSTLILSLIYIDRLCEKNITLTKFNIHRILFAAILIAVKYNEDSFYENSYYAQIAGIKNKELKVIEYTFLEMINFNAYVDEDTFNLYKESLYNFNI
jgi:hypothetical protein